jgi:hypothetical protein
VLAAAELAVCNSCSNVDTWRLNSIVFWCCVESSSASLSYAPDFDSSRARVSRFDASSEEMRELRVLTSAVLFDEEDLRVLTSVSRLERVFSIHLLDNPSYYFNPQCTYLILVESCEGLRFRSGPSPQSP